MRILMLSYEFPPVGGGGARVVHGLSRELVRLGHEVDIVTMGFRGLPVREDVDGVQVHRVPCRRRRAHLCTLPEAFSYVCAALPVVLRLARRQSFDVNHTHFILPDGLLAYVVRRFTGLPYVITAHGSDVPGYNPHRLKLAHRLAAPLWQTVVRHAAGLVCPSRILQGLVEARTRTASITTIPNGIDVDWFHPNGSRRRRILVVARLFERKGVQYLLQAIAREPLGYELHVVGEGPYLPVLRQMVPADAPVTFWGWLDHHSPQLTTLLETSSIFVLPSEAENFPISLLEAMAAGLAVVTTAGTGCAEVVGETGVLVPARDAASLASALKRLVGDEALQRRLGQAARERVEAQFSWPAVAQRYTALYAARPGALK